MRRNASSVAWILMLAGAWSAPRAAAEVFTPPACNAPPFSDVVLDAFCPWVQQFGADQISAGCDAGKYCPTNPVTRQELAVLLERAMRGTATWDPAQGVYRRTVIVHPVPGSPTDAGAALLAALAGITDNADNNGWLVKLEPGLYDLGTQSLVMKPWVDLEGSGQRITAILSAAGRAAIADGAVHLAPNSELRDLTVENLGGDAYSVAVYSAVGGTLTRVSAQAGGSTTRSVGVYFENDIALRDSEVYAGTGFSGDAYGIEGVGAGRASVDGTYLRPVSTGLISFAVAFQFTGQATLVGVRAAPQTGGAAQPTALDATGGGAFFEVYHSRLDGVVIAGTGATVRLFDDTVQGGVAGTGSVRCVDTAQDFHALTRACQLAQCDDGVSNDADGLVDMADPECTSPSDESESL